MKIQINERQITAAQIPEAKRIAKEYSSQYEELKDMAVIVAKHYYPSPLWRVLEIKASVQRNQYCYQQYGDESEDLDIIIEALLVDGDSYYINRFSHVNFNLSAAYQIAGDETPADVDLQVYRRVFVKE